VLPQLDENASILLKDSQCPDGTPLVTTLEDLLALLGILDQLALIERRPVTAPSQ